MEKIGNKVLAYDPTKLNEQQIRMVELFKTPWPEEYYSEVRDLIAKLLAKRIDEQMERLKKESVGRLKCMMIGENTKGVSLTK